MTKKIHLTEQQPGRLGSLDVLRGFDLFCLVFFQPVVGALSKVVNTSWMNAINFQFKHVPWEGFVFWDIIMPLFMFMAGVSMPFAFSKYMGRERKAKLYKRIFKRVVSLWILGMMCQGNLLALDVHKVYLFSNTLQAIAVGYLISAFLLVCFQQKWQIIISVGLLFIYWVLLTFIDVNGYGGGNYTEDLNLAEYVDRLILGRFRDGVTVTASGLDFGHYRYTWLISSLNFGVTVMTGVFAGKIMKSNLEKIKKIQWLVVCGITMIIIGLLWGLQMPIIKHIWSSSMTLLSSGICFSLMALFYYLVDYRDYGKYLNWLKIYGMNSILAYVIFELVNFNSVTRSLLYGTEQFLGAYYPTLITFANGSVILAILLIMYRKRIFLKV